jgi:hypothetical protein
VQKRRRGDGTGGIRASTKWSSRSKAMPVILTTPEEFDVWMRAP